MLIDLAKYITKEEFVLKLITKEEMNRLLKNGIVHNSHNGIVNNEGYNIGFYRTKNKRYIEDKYVDIARELG